MKAIVSLVLGELYQNRFRRQCYANWKSYASRHGLDLIVFEEPLDDSARAKSRSPAWQKCLAVTDDRVRHYEQVAWIDSDILISPTAPNIFDAVPAETVGAVADFAYPSPEEYRLRLTAMEHRWRAQGTTIVSALTPHAYYEAFGLPGLDHVAQTGVIVLSPEFHRDIFRGVYAQYEDRGSAAFHYEMRPLSYEVVRSGRVTWLNPRFNMVISFGLPDQYLNDLTTPYSLLDRVGVKAELPLSQRQRRMKGAYRALFRDSYFLHFAGRQHEMFLL